MSDMNDAATSSAWQTVQVAAWIGVGVWSLTFVTVYVHLWVAT